MLMAMADCKAFVYSSWMLHKTSRRMWQMVYHIAKAVHIVPPYDKMLHCPIILYIFIEYSILQNTIYFFLLSQIFW